MIDRVTYGIKVGGVEVEWFIYNFIGVLSEEGCYGGVWRGANSFTLSIFVRRNLEQA